MRKPLVYIAAPYTTPDPILNTRRVCLAADELVAAGAAVIVPHLCLTWHLVSPKTYETWLQIDYDLIAHCDALVRLPGISDGAEKEIEFANSLGSIYLAYGMDEILDWLRNYKELIA